MSLLVIKTRYHLLVMIVVIAIGLVVVASSFPPAMAEMEYQTIKIGGKEYQLPDSMVSAHPHNELEKENGLSQAHQIKLLIGVVILLFGGNMWWTKRYINTQEERESKRDKEIKGINRKLDTLQGEHDMSIQIRGCAADPSALETSIRDAVKNSLQPLFDYHLHNRGIDKDK